jgi:hypothetical protein
VIAEKTRFGPLQSTISENVVRSSSKLFKIATPQLLVMTDKGETQAVRVSTDYTSATKSRWKMDPKSRFAGGSLHFNQLHPNLQ